jgi:hypothetical protein
MVLNYECAVFLHAEKGKKCGFPRVGKIKESFLNIPGVYGSTDTQQLPERQ